MTSAPEADLDDKNGASATFASQVDGDSPANVAATEPPADEITDFFLAAGDKIDLSDVAAYFDMSAEEVQDCLYYNEKPSGTEIGIEVDGVPHKIAVVHSVTAADLCSSAPWIFDAAEAAAIGHTRDAPETPHRAPDEFVFDPAIALPPPKTPIAIAKPADVSQLAEALGLSEAQVLDALNNRGFLPDGTELSSSDAASAALTNADALVL